jgi:glutathione S-transferase
LESQQHCDGANPPSAAVIMQVEPQGARRYFERAPESLGWGGRWVQRPISAAAFYAYAPVKIKFAIDRFSMEVKRQLDVLDRQLADNQFIAGDEYTIRRYGDLAVVRQRRVERRLLQRPAQVPADARI